MPHNRIVTLDGALNFRDIGGYKNDKGQALNGTKFIVPIHLVPYPIKIKLN